MSGPAVDLERKSLKRSPEGFLAARAVKGSSEAVRSWSQRIVCRAGCGRWEHCWVEELGERVLEAREQYVTLGP